MRDADDVDPSDKVLNWHDIEVVSGVHGYTDDSSEKSLFNRPDRPCLKWILNVATVGGVVILTGMTGSANFIEDKSSPNTPQ